MSLPTLTKNAYGSVDILLKQGETFEIILALIDKSKDPPEPLDLTGYTARGQIRKDPSSNIVAGTFTCSILPDGKVKVYMEASQTAAIPAGKKVTDSQSHYQYDIELEDSTGRVLRILQGKLVVDPEVTKNAP